MIPAVLPTYTRADLAFARGEGAWLESTDGRRFLDFNAGIAVSALGHAHPRMVETLTTQGAKLWHVSNLYRIPEQEALAEALTEATFADTVFFTNSGTETLELAVKMARRYHAERGTPRAGFVSFHGSFHGRSTAAIAAAGSEKMVAGFGPLMPGFTQVDFGDLEAAQALIAEDTAAVIVEPIQGEGGIHVASDAFLQGLRAACDAVGALLIFDEVQCGMGRTGRLFAHEASGVTPDIMMVAKGIGGGFPLGALLATEAAAAAMTAGSHGSTYGGNPLGCALGLTVMEVVNDPDFLAEVRRKSGLLRQKLEGLVAAHPDLLAEVRGEGLMLGLQCKRPVGDLVAAGLDAGVLTVAAAGDTLRLLPALTLTDAELAEGITRLDAACTALSHG